MNYFITLLLLFLLLLPFTVWAVSGSYTCDPNSSFCNPIASTNKSIPTLVGNVIKTGLGIIGSLALVLFIMAGFTWLTAKGNAQKIKTATDIMLWAAIGLAVVFSSYALLSFVFNVIS